MKRPLHPDPTFNPTFVDRNRAQQIADEFLVGKTPPNRRRDFADLQIEAEGHNSKIDPT